MQQGSRAAASPLRGLATFLKGVGWRKALRAAITDTPFVKGEGLSPKSRRELLGHSLLSLSL